MTIGNATPAPRWIAERHFATVEAVDRLDTQPERCFTVSTAGWDYPCLFSPSKGAGTLLVMLSGAVDQKKMALPAFARHKEAERYKSHILCVSDPFLGLSADLTLGWYTGTEERDVIPGVIEIANRVAGLAGIEASKIVYFGSSGGGFGALSAAARCNGRAIAINPQTDIVQYYPRFVTDHVKFFNGLRPEEARASYPTRFSAIESLSRSTARAVICQNKADKFHLNKHFAPLCRELKIPESGGESADRRFLSILYDDEASGHGREPEEFATQLAGAPLEWLLR